MLEAIVQYWQLSLAFVVISILTVFVCKKAYKASKRTRLEREKIIDRLKYENKTRAEFSVLTAGLIESAEPKKLFDGVALNIQAKLEKESDMNAAFEKLPQPQKTIYALYYLVQDGTEKLSEFFRKNGKPLIPAAGEAVTLIFGCKAGDLYNKEYAAFDDDNEEISLLPAEIEKQNEEFALLISGMDISGLVAGYIRENARAFID